MISKRVGTSLLIVATFVVIPAALLAPRVPQPDSYHHLADQRSWLGVPRFGDVMSNVPFAGLQPSYVASDTPQKPWN